MIRPAPPVAASVVLRYPLQIVSTADQPDVVQHINNTGIAVAAFVTTTQCVHQSGTYAMLRKGMLEHTSFKQSLGLATATKRTVLLRG